MQVTFAASLAVLAPLAGCTRPNPTSPANPSDMANPSVSSPLTIATSALPPATVGVPYRTTLLVSGDRAGEAHWSTTGTSGGSGLPPGIALDSSVGPSVRLVGTSTVAGSYGFTVEVTDSAGEHDARQLTLIVGGALAIDGALPAATEGRAFDATLTARGGYGNSYHWSVSSGALPPGLTLTAHGATAELAGTPLPGSDDFVVTLADEVGDQTTRPFTIHVASAMTLTHGNVPPAVQGRSFSLPLDVSGGTGHYVWSLGGSAPPGLTLVNGAAGAVTLAGTLAAPGSFKFTVNVADDNLGSASASLTVSVTPALEVVTTHLPDGQLAVPYSVGLTAQGGTSSAYQWSVSSGALPPGVTLSAATGASPPATLSGTPTRSGSYTFTIAVATTSGDSASRSFTMAIGDNPPSITTTSLSDAAFGASYDGTINGTSAVGGAVAWKIVAGALPPGIALAASSSTSVHVSGVPKLRGTFAFTVQMSDSGGSSERPLGITVVRRAGVEIVAALLPAARVGQPYSATVASRGSSGSVAWTVDGGALPSGLVLAGNGTSATLSGTPTTSGSFPFSLRATDATSNDGCSFAIRVAPSRMYIAAATETAVGDSSYSSTVRVREIQARAPGVESTLVSGATSSEVFSPSFSPSGDWLTYPLRDDSVSATPVYAADLRGPVPSAPARLYNNTLWDLVWSSDDAHAVMAIPPAYDLDVTDFGGAAPSTTKVNAAASNGIAAWSPDGSRLAYLSADGKSFSIYASGAIVTMVLPSGLSASWPSWIQNPWLPDGRGLFFEGRDSAQPNDQLFTIDAANGAQPMALSDPSVPLLGGNLYLSPDGGGLVFLSAGPYTSNDEDSEDAWYVDLSTRQLAGAVKINGAPVVSIASVVWSPDSRQILLPMEYELSPPLTIARAQVGVAPLTTVNLGSLSSKNSSAPTWAADSRHLLLRGSDGNLYEASIDGAAPLLLGTQAYNGFWSVSSTRRAYVYVGAAGLSYVVAANGAASTPIVLDADDVNSGNVAVSRTLETVFYGAQSNAVYLVDLSGSAPGTPAQLFAADGPTWFSIGE